MSAINKGISDWQQRSGTIQQCIENGFIQGENLIFQTSDWRPLNATTTITI